jgi:hypothetical protein
MKTRLFLFSTAAFALAIAGLSIPSPVFSAKALAQMTATNGQAAKGKKTAGTANTDKPKGKLYKSPGDRARCRMGNC